MILALTGATGFVGSHALDLARDAGHQVRALTRRPQPARPGVVWIDGALDRPAALARLADGADAVLHVAGVVSGSADQFHAGNVEGTRAMLAAAKGAGVERFVLVSSLAAREPGLSDYGRSKAAAEALVTAGDRDWTIVRPPAVFGPRDAELRELFRLARRHLVPLPPAGGRLSVIYAPELARLLLALAPPGTLSHRTVEPDDGMPGGWDHRDLVRAVGRAVGSRVLPLPLPRALLNAASAVDQATGIAGRKLTRDRVRYFCHPDWVARLAPPAELWTPTVDTPQALADTARWYRANDLL